MCSSVIYEVKYIAARVYTFLLLYTHVSSPRKFYCAALLRLTPSGELTRVAAKLWYTRTPVPVTPAVMRCAHGTRAVGAVPAVRALTATYSHPSYQ